MPTMTDDLNHPEHQEHTFIEQEEVTAEYWDEHRLGELHAAAQYAAAELNEGGVEDEHQQYYDHDVIVPTLPAVESPLHGSLKPKALSVHDLKWNKHIEELRRFKEQHGHIDVPRVEEYKKLYKFLDNQGQSYRRLIEGKRSTLTVRRIKDLDELGIKWKVEPAQVAMGMSQPHDETEPFLKLATKQSETWDSRFEQLKKWHAQSGNFRVPYKINLGKKRSRDGNAVDPDEETIKLGGWVKRQRSLYASGSLPAERTEKLNSIGFEFTPSRQSKDERIELQLGLLDALRKNSALNASQVADLNYLYDYWKHRAETGSNRPAFGNPGTALASNNKHANKWAVQYEKLKEFKLKHGHMRIPRNGEDKEVKALSKWVDRQRDLYSKRQRGEKDALDDERISRLESIGFVWALRQDVTQFSVKRARPSLPVDVIPDGIDLSHVFIGDNHRDVKEGVNNVYQYRWETKLEEFKRYKAKIGIPRVSAKVMQMYPDWLQQLQEMRKWIDNQRTFYHNGMTGKKNPLSDERIRLLVQAGFDFGSQKGKPVHYKSWNEKVEELKEFKKKYGHTRVKAADKSDPLFKLSKWCQNQRTHYWMFMKGEKSCINEERIEVLEALEFEWRLKPGRKSIQQPSLEAGDSINHTPMQAGEEKQATAFPLQETQKNEEEEKKQVAEDTLTAAI
ncbi:hypothetical protein ACHAWO_000513 [Cyclotella atomus]|uniref:Helicase-associated domain-containing protein n=1 Tax=Cyclotella atomus TaxID=382360 RepID=A0ABD3NBY2_9STRA